MPSIASNKSSRDRNRLGDSICSTDGDIDIGDLVGHKSLTRSSRFLGSNTSLNSSGPPGRKKARTRPSITPQQEVAAAISHLNRSGQWALVDELLDEEKQQLSVGLAISFFFVRYIHFVLIKYFYFRLISIVSSPSSNRVLHLVLTQVLILALMQHCQIH